MLDKYVKFLPLGLFSLYFLKAAILSVSYPEACILAVLGLVSCYFQSKNHEKLIEDLEQKLIKSNKDLEEKTMTAIKSFENKVQKVESIEAQINALKLQSLTRQGFSQAK